MIPALFALAAAMLIAGVTAVVEGFPYVRLESGMAMVYGGSVLGSSGFLLFGLAVVATWLKRIERVLRDGPAYREDDFPAPAREPHEPAPDPMREIASPAFTQAPSGMAGERPRIEPSLVMPSGPARERDPAEPELPLPGLAAPLVLPAKPADTNDDLFVPAATVAEPDAKPAPIPATPPKTGTDPVTAETPLRSSLDSAPDAVPGPGGERVVVGRYSSGGNTYMMFDNGAIEADTPNGRFTFASLDELKAFVDGGGEAGTRGAA